MNPDPSQRSRSLCGLEIGTGFVPNGPDSAEKGSLYDPQSGKTYSGNMELDNGDLKLRGYVGVALLGRTERWRRVAADTQECRP